MTSQEDFFSENQLLKEKIRAQDALIKNLQDEIIQLQKRRLSQMQSPRTPKRDVSSSSPALVRISPRILELPSHHVFNIVEAKVIRNFYPDSRDKRQIEVKKGDKVKVLAKKESGWWKGENLTYREGKKNVGYFPAYCVQETSIKVL